MDTFYRHFSRAFQTAYRTASQKGLLVGFQSGSQGLKTFLGRYYVAILLALLLFSAYGSHTGALLHLLGGSGS